MSHAELDVAEELDRGDVAGLAGALRRAPADPARPARRRRLLRHRHRAPHRDRRRAQGVST